MRLLTSILFYLFAITLFGSDNIESQLNAGVGVSLPASNLNLALDHNPVGLTMVNGHLLALGYFKGSSSDINQRDLAYSYGSSGFGFGLNHKTNNTASGSSAQLSLGLGYQFDSFAVAVSSTRDTDSNASDVLDFSTLGLLIGAKSSHRFGFVFYSWTNENSKSTNQEYSLGYTYVDNSFALSLDYQSYKNSRQALVPAISLFSPKFQFSVAQKIWQGDKGNSDVDSTRLALGVNFDSFRLAVYNDVLLETGIELSCQF